LIPFWLNLDFRIAAPNEFEGLNPRAKSSDTAFKVSLINRRARAFRWAFAEAENRCEKRISNFSERRVFDV
jgi:hypothetical protein